MLLEKLMGHVAVASLDAEEADKLRRQVRPAVVNSSRDSNLNLEHEEDPTGNRGAQLVAPGDAPIAKRYRRLSCDFVKILTPQPLRGQLRAALVRVHVQLFES